MKNISSLPSALLATLAGLAVAIVPALTVALVFSSVAAAASTFIASMLVLTLCQDYAPRPQPLTVATTARSLAKYPLAA
ncbi:hypothetical protein [Actomonas aquatica]|uniref:SLC26A/SulP transporter domain-containing protein n=1 Tax=Actomonas aquatica TaxID=2866162 RepID=A0ABZ1CDK8_9BACT|nr:hypothetical protein [Opitutus sp. WL0086]WRQ89506.1 hypothetical protein K1X11_008795 [Opitutus sp. WL0086]